MFGFSEHLNINVQEIRTSEDEMFGKSEHSYKEYKEPLKSRDFSTAAAETKPAVEAVAQNGHLSKFSLEECLRYATICKNRAEPIRSVEALARSAYKTGEMDASIEATFCPANPAPTVEQHIEYDDNFKRSAETPPTRSHPKSVLAAHVSDLRMMQLSKDELFKYEQSYTPEDWQWIMEELGKFEDSG